MLDYHVSSEDPLSEWARYTQDLSALKGVFQRAYVRSWTWAWSWPLMKCSSPFSCPSITIAVHSTHKIRANTRWTLIELKWLLIGIHTEISLPGEFVEQKVWKVEKSNEKWDLKKNNLEKRKDVGILKRKQEILEELLEDGLSIFTRGAV